MTAEENGEPGNTTPKDAAIQDDRLVATSTSNRAHVVRKTRLLRSPRADHQCVGLPSTWDAFDHAFCRSHLAGVPLPPLGEPTEIGWPIVPPPPSNLGCAPLATPGSVLFLGELHNHLLFSWLRICVSPMMQRIRSLLSALRSLRPVPQNRRVHHTIRVRSRYSLGIAW